MPYHDELLLSMGLGNSPQLSMSTKNKTQHTRRDRESTQQQVQGMQAQRDRASTTHALGDMGICQGKHADKCAKKGPGTRRQVQSTHTQARHAAQAPGQGTGRVAVAIPWHDFCSILWSMAGLPWVLLGASGLVREVVHVQGTGEDSVMQN